jgi:hypothetical protein
LYINRCLSTAQCPLSSRCAMSSLTCRTVLSGDMVPQAPISKRADEERRMMSFRGELLLLLPSPPEEVGMIPVMMLDYIILSYSNCWRFGIRVVVVVVVVVISIAVVEDCRGAVGQLVTIWFGLVGRRGEKSLEKWREDHS